ncbi:hypothetical protein TrRE_jg3195, partial [Triparma retinervis]
MGVGVAGRQKKMHHRAKPAVQKVAANRVPAYVDVVAGGVAGLTVRLLTAPLDLIKIRLQLSPTAASTFSTFRGVLKNEGPFAFFKGNIAATYLWV